MVRVTHSLTQKKNADFSSNVSLITNEYSTEGFLGGRSFLIGLLLRCQILEKAINAVSPVVSYSDRHSGRFGFCGHPVSCYKSGRDPSSFFFLPGLTTSSSGSRFLSCVPHTRPPSETPRIHFFASRVVTQWFLIMSDQCGFCPPAPPVKPPPPFFGRDDRHPAFAGSTCRRFRG